MYVHKGVEGTRIPHLVRRYVKAEFCIGIGGGGGQGGGQGARISYLVSGNIKAELEVGIGEGAAKGHRNHI